MMALVLHSGTTQRRCDVSSNLTSRHARVMAELPAVECSSRPYPVQIDLRDKVLQRPAEPAGSGPNVRVEHGRSEAQRGPRPPQSGRAALRGLAASGLRGLPFAVADRGASRRQRRGREHAAVLETEIMEPNQQHSRTRRAGGYPFPGALVPLELAVSPGSYAQLRAPPSGYPHPSTSCPKRLIGDQHGHLPAYACTSSSPTCKIAAQAVW